MINDFFGDLIIYVCSSNKKGPLPDDGVGSSVVCDLTKS